MTTLSTDTDSRRKAILRAAVAVFGRLGYRKTSMEDIAQAAGLSKQGLYLHTSGKEDIFLAAMRLYLEDGLQLVGEKLADHDATLLDRLTEALDAWFGRHLATFVPASFDVIETGDRLSAAAIEGYKTAFRDSIAKAIAEAPEYTGRQNACTPEELAQVLFTAGLSWKQPGQTPQTFRSSMRLAARACCQTEEEA